MSAATTLDSDVRSRAMGLIEREGQLGALRAWLADAAGGAGRLVFVGGEAGAGKSALVGEFCRSLPPDVPVYLGACEPLSALRPLGPLADIAPSLGADIVLRMREGDRNGVFTACLKALTVCPAPTVMVIEDAHLADDSTLDLLQYLSRRMDAIGALFVITYRDDVDRTEPISVLLGDLASISAVRRMAVPPLSRTAVAELALDTDLDPVKLHAETNGNAFFVTEILRQGSHRVPPSVADAILARVRRLRPTARAEAHWLAGDTHLVAGDVGEPFELALALNSPWSIGELGWWLWRAGELDSPPDGAVRPFALQMAGKWEAAASEWAQHGFPYEAAMALLDSPHVKDLRSAVETFDRLGCGGRARIRRATVAPTRRCRPTRTAKLDPRQCGRPDDPRGRGARHGRARVDRWGDREGTVHLTANGQPPRLVNLDQAEG